MEVTSTAKIELTSKTTKEQSFKDEGSKKYTPKSNDFFFLFAGSPKSALDNIACDLSKKMSSKIQF